jgi:hypothetical protein
MARIGKATIAIAAALMLCCGSASAAGIPGSDGVIHACVVGKGKARGSVRLVRSAHNCKRRRGERPVSWNAQGASAQSVAGPEGRSGQKGDPGVQGEPGLAGKVEQTLLDTIATQKTEIESLTTQVQTLGGELSAVQGTVDDVCTQLGAVTSQVDAVATVVGGLGLTGGLLGLGGLSIPALPTPLGAFSC